METKLGIAMAVIALATSGAAQAQESTGFCADLEQVIAGGQETPVFASLPVWSTQMRSMFAFEHCGVSPDRGSFSLNCTQYDPARLGISRYLGVREVLEIIADRIKTCRPDAVRIEYDRPPPRLTANARLPRNEGDTAFIDIEGARIAVSYMITSRFTRLGLEAYDCAARAAYEAENREAWRRTREAEGRTLREGRPLPPEDPLCAREEAASRD